MKCFNAIRKPIASLLLAPVLAFWFVLPAAEASILKKLRTMFSDCLLLLEDVTVRKDDPVFRAHLRGRARSIPQREWVEDPFDRSNQEDNFRKPSLERIASMTSVDFNWDSLSLRGIEILNDPFFLPYVKPSLLDQIRQMQRGPGYRYSQRVVPSNRPDLQMILIWIPRSIELNRFDVIPFFRFVVDPRSFSTGFSSPVKYGSFVAWEVRSSRLLWSPVLQEKATLAEARAYCGGMGWRLPRPDEAVELMEQLGSAADGSLRNLFSFVRQEFYWTDFDDIVRGEGGRTSHRQVFSTTNSVSRESLAEDLNGVRCVKEIATLPVFRRTSVL